MSRMLAACLLLFASWSAGAFDHAYRDWDDLLKKHVTYQADGNASRVSYTGFLANHAGLRAVLESFSAVPRTEFDRWSKPDQQAFLINAYNAFTVEKVLQRYPDLGSIRDFGTLIGNPWKDRFFTLLGAKASLDAVEHEMLRKPGVYDEPRVHFALVCASIGCPMLRRDAFTGPLLDGQLEDAARRFLSDRTRNRFNPDKRRLEVSRLFDWYGKDFEKGHGGIGSVKAFLAAHAQGLADREEDRALVRAQKADLRFLDYDWGLNDARP